MTRGSAVLGVSVVLTACNAISGLDDDFALAPLLPVEAGSTEDGDVLVEAGAPVDAAPDSTAPDAAPLPFTCTDTLFCWDFEAPADATSWGWTLGWSGPVLLVENAAGFTGKGLRARSGPSASSALWQDRMLPAPWTTQTLSLDFDFRIVSQTVSYSVIGAIEFSGREHGLSLYGTAAKCPNGVPCLDDNEQQDRGHDLAGSLPYTPNVWHHGQVTLRRAGQGYGGTVKVDTTVVDDRATGAMPNGAPPTTVRVGVGAFYPGPSQGGEVTIDNVVLRYR